MNEKRKGERKKEAELCRDKRPIRGLASRQVGRVCLREIVKYTRRSSSREAAAPVCWIHLSVPEVLREGRTEGQVIGTGQERIVERGSKRREDRREEEKRKTR